MRLAGGASRREQMRSAEALPLVGCREAIFGVFFDDCRSLNLYSCTGGDEKNLYILFKESPVQLYNLTQT